MKFGKYMGWFETETIRASSFAGPRGLDGLLVREGIIEGNQIQVAAFSLEYLSYLTGLSRPID